MLPFISPTPGTFGHGLLRQRAEKMGAGTKERTEKRRNKKVILKDVDAVPYADAD